MMSSIGGVMIGIGLIFITNLLTVLLNWKKMNRGILALLVVGTIFGIASVLNSNSDLKDRLDQLKGQVAEMSRPAVEFVPGESKFNQTDSLWQTECIFRTNPALNARDVKITVRCNDSIVDFDCDRVSDKPGIFLAGPIQRDWDERPFSFKLEAEFLAADESMRAFVLSRRQLDTPVCTIETWSRKLSLGSPL